ncbi:hypothetical protein K440DRAFT_563317, partial [Wilcoxina mikolae CBS 423.85]
ETRLLLLHSYSTYFIFEFYQNILNHNITSICLPAHSIYLLKHLHMNLFGFFLKPYDYTTDNLCYTYK